MMLEIIKCSIIFGVFSNIDLVQSKKQETRIMKGDLVDIDKHPYMVVIIVGGRQHCGGSILSDRWILTAAHCTGSYEPNKPIKYKVLVGSTKVLEGKKYDVLQVVVHPNFDAKNHFIGDIAMMQVKGEFTFGPKVQKVTIAHIEKHSQEYNNCVTAGWGMTDAQDDKSLQELTMSSLPLNDCGRFKPFRSNVCVQATKEQAAPCFGDSGGPLVCDGLQVGLLSYGSRDCDRKDPEVYTAVPAYYSWIRKILKHDGVPRPEQHRTQKMLDVTDFT